MGSDYETTGALQPSQILRAFMKYLPDTMTSVGESIPGMTDTQARSSADVTDIYNQSNLEQLAKYAPEQARIGQQLLRDNALAGAETNLAQITGAGGDAARAARTLAEETNPEYYKAAGAASSGAKNLLDNIVVGGLSPGEANAVERSLNQTKTASGNLGLVNPTNIISDALNFGGAYNNKLGILSNAVNTASGVAGSTANNAGVNSTGVALSQPNSSAQTNFGQGQFVTSNPQQSVLSTGNSFNLAQNILGSLTSGSNAAQGAGATLGASNSPSSYLGAVCCFIFLEAYHGRLPKCVRKGRDKYYGVNPDIAAGYRRMASWLVPLMRDNPIVRWLVWTLMINPITVHLSKPKKNWNKRITHFWLKFWAITGKNKEEYNYRMAFAYVSNNCSGY